MAIIKNDLIAGDSVNSIPSDSQDQFNGNDYIEDEKESSITINPAPSNPSIDDDTETDKDKDEDLNIDLDKPFLKRIPFISNIQCTKNRCDTCYTSEVTSICPVSAIIVNDEEILEINSDLCNIRPKCLACIDNCPNGAISLFNIVPDLGDDDLGEDDDTGDSDLGNDDNDNPSGSDPSNDNPSGSDPGNDTPSGSDPGNDNPGGSDPGNDTPGSSDPGNDTPGSSGSGNNNNDDTPNVSLPISPSGMISTEGVISIKGPVFIKEVNNESIALKVAMSIFTNTDLSKITSIPDYAAKCIKYGEDFEKSYNNYINKNVNARPDKPTKLLDSAQDPTSIELTSEKLKFNGQLDYEETKVISVLCSRPFEVTTSKRFISTSITSGVADKEIDITITCSVNKTNTERTGEVIITCDDGTTKSIAITQTNNQVSAVEEETPSIGDISASETTSVQLDYNENDNFVTITLKSVSAEFINYLKSDKPEADNVYLMIEARHPKGKDGSSKHQTTPLVCTKDSAIKITKDNLNEILNNPHHITIRPFTRYRIAWDKRKQTDTKFKYKLSVRATFRNEHTGFQQIKNIYTPSGFIATQYLANNTN